MLPEVEHADTGQTIRLAGVPIKLSETPGEIRRRAPFLGEHTEEILVEAGLSADRIEEYLDAGGVKRSNDNT
jgi:crotonobetainyl-CoA:carnitine CoA-transferase CaiB-like acyl-CoA transferase